MDKLKNVTLSMLLLAFLCKSYGHIPNNELQSILDLFDLKDGANSIDISTTVSVSIDTLLERLNCVQPGLSYNQCVKCLNSAHVLELVKDPSGNETSSSVTSLEVVQRLSVVLLSHVLNFRTACKVVEKGPNESPIFESVCHKYVVCRDLLLGGLGAIRIHPKQNTSSSKASRTGNIIPIFYYSQDVSLYVKLEEILEDVLRKIKAVYEPKPQTDCFSAGAILSKLDINDNSTDKDKGANFEERLSVFVVKNLLEGRCIDVGDASSNFVEYLFNRYGDNKTNTIDENGITQLLGELKHEQDDHGHDDHGSDHGHDDHDHVHDDHDHVHDDHDHVHDDHDHVHDDHDHVHDDHDHVHDDHDHVHDDHDHTHGHNHDHGHNHVHHLDHDQPQASKNITPDQDHEAELVAYYVESPRTKRHVQESAENHTNVLLIDSCLTSSQLLDKFSHTSPKNTINKAEFLQLCPALIHQAVSGVCKKSKESVKSPMTSMELYGYSTIAVFIISLVSLVVVVILPLIGKKIYQYIMMCMIGLGFGTMAGDAFLHLIPEGLGLHSHDHSDHEHHHDGPIEIPNYVYQQLALVLAIYGIFLFETLLEMFTGSHQDEGHHGHSHIPQNVPNPLAKKGNPKTDSVIELTNYNNSSLSINAEAPDKTDKSDIEPVFKAPALFCGMTSLALVITVADAIHNIGDGLAIGAAFSSSVQSGLSTSIAVLCHELPHEFGDFVILLSTGLSFKRALIINFLSALSCFIGLYIGIIFGEEEKARQWMLIVTAGIFLYVALSEMLPELKQNKFGSKYTMFFVKNFGILLGLGLMVVISIYEERITI